MHIFLDIEDKYKKPELHICSDRKSKEVLNLKELLEDMFNEIITVHDNQETKKIASYEIVRIYSENKKVYVRTSENTYEVRERLYSLEEELKDKGFIRISYSEIVNISLIDKMDMSYSGTIKMYMKNGDITYVSRRYVGKIKETLNKENKNG